MLLSASHVGFGITSCTKVLPSNRPVVRSDGIVTAQFSPPRYAPTIDQTARLHLRFVCSAPTGDVNMIYIAA